MKNKNTTKSNIKIVERDKMDTITHKCISTLGISTLLKSGGVKLVYGPKPIHARIPFFNIASSAMHEK